MSFFNSTYVRRDGTTALTANWDAGAFDIKALSFSIGANTLTTSEFGFLDGQDQAVKTTSSPTFVGLTLSGLTTTRLLYSVNDVLTDSANLTYDGTTLTSLSNTYINLSSTAALKVGSTPTFQVDTTNGRIGINAIPSSDRTFGLYALDSTATTLSYLYIDNTANPYQGSLSATSTFYCSRIQCNSSSADRTGNLIMEAALVAVNNLSGFSHTTSGKILNIIGGEYNIADSAVHTNAGTLTEQISNYFASTSTATYSGTGAEAITIRGGEFIGAFYPVTGADTGTLTSNVYGGLFECWADYTGYGGGILNSNFIGVNAVVSLTNFDDFFGTSTGYGVKVDVSTTDYQYTINTPTLYGVYINAVTGGTGTKWAYYNAVAVNNFMGLDNAKTYFGTGLDLALYHDGTNSFIYNDTGILKIQDAGSGIWIGTASTELLSFYGGTAVNRPDALTAQLTTITHTAPGTPDYALQNLVQNTGFGFATADEGNTTLSVIANLQTRLAEVEARLEELNLITAN